MNKAVGVQDITPVLEELVKSGTDVNFTVTGNSMFPMLRSRADSVIITKAPAVLKKYDLPLYRRENGDYILHRIVKRRGDVYSMNGDNQYMIEHGIKRSQIVGVVRAFCRKGRLIECSDFKYMLYCRIWVAVRPLRGFAYKVYNATVRRFKRRKK